MSLSRVQRWRGDCQSCVCVKDGQVFIFTSEGDPCRKDDWRPISIDGTMEVLPNYLVIPQQLRSSTFTLTVKIDIQKLSKACSYMDGWPALWTIKILQLQIHNNKSWCHKRLLTSKTYFAFCNYFFVWIILQRLIFTFSLISFSPLVILMTKQFHKGTVCV